MVPLDNEQLTRACAVAKTQWLRQLLAEHLPSLITLSDSDADLEIAQQWDSMIKGLFAARGLTSLSQQKNLITDVRNAIKVFDPHHPTLSVIGFSSHEWIEINSAASAATEHRTTQFLAQPQAIANKAADLLHSPQWSEVAAGLAVATGRRVSEILQTAEFSLQSNYSVLFTGAAKRRDESIPLSFEIPTLVKAQSVLDAIANLRRDIHTEGLTNRQINDKYEQAVAQQCERHFRDLVPLRDGKNNLYTHLFRAVYATIAAHWFCPPTVSDLEFRAYIQGHFKILHETNPEKRTSMAAQRHYWDYKISDGQGNIDGRLGIKLQQPGVQVLSAFSQSTTTPTTDSSSYRDLVHLRVARNDRNSLATIQDQLHLSHRAAAFGFVVELAQSFLTTADTLHLSTQELMAQLPSLLEQLSSTPTTKKEAETPEPEILEDNFPLTDNQQLSLNLIDADGTDTTRSDSATDEKSVDSVDNLHSHSLLQRMDRQQQSLENLTHAIHGLVQVLTPNAATVSTPPTPKPPPTAPTPRQLRSQRSRDKVNRYVNAIMAYNDVPNRPHADKWLVSIAALKKLTHSGQTVIYDVQEQRQAEIQAHHLKHQLHQYHNQKGRNAPKIETVICLG